MLSREELTRTLADQPLTGLDAPQTELGEVLERIYSELRQIAAGYLRQERANHTLQPTALVHEAYARLADQTQVPWSDAAHFRAITARVMRQVLVDHARKHGALKRGGDRIRVTLAGAETPVEMDALDLLALDEAMGRLAELQERKARVVELLFFGGLTHAEAARVIGVSQKTIESDWYMARAWLGKEMGGPS